MPGLRTANTMSNHDDSIRYAANQICCLLALCTAAVCACILAAA